MKFIIERPQAQEILNHLQTRPYVEVFKLIAMLTGLRPLEDPRCQSSESKECHPPVSSESSKDTSE